MLATLIMDAKKKANELVENINNELSQHIFNGSFDIAQKLAELTVEEILNDNPNIYDSDRLNHKYWKEVKRQISLL